METKNLREIDRVADYLFAVRSVTYLVTSRSCICITTNMIAESYRYGALKRSPVILSILTTV